MAYEVNTELDRLKEKKAAEVVVKDLKIRCYPDKFTQFDVSN